MYQITGKILLIGDTKQFSEKFKKRTVVIVTDGKFPQQVELQATNLKTSLLDNLEIGQYVTFNFGIDGRPYAKEGQETRYFNSLTIISVDGQKAEKGMTPNVEFSEPTRRTPEPYVENTDDGNSLPF